MKVVQREGALVISAGKIADPDPESAVLKVWLGAANVNVDPPMLGTTALVEGELIFIPRFPLRADTGFNVGIQQNGNLKPIHIKVRTSCCRAVEDENRCRFSVV